MNCWLCGQLGRFTYAAAGRMECEPCGVRWSVPTSAAPPSVVATVAQQAAL